MTKDFNSFPRPPEFVWEFMHNALFECSKEIANYLALIKLTEDFREIMGFIDCLGFEIDFSDISIKDLEARIVPFTTKRDEILKYFEAMGDIQQ